MLRRRGKADEALPSHSDADPLLDGKPGTPVGPAGLRHISADRNLRSILRRIKQRPLAFFLGLATFLYEIFVLVAPKVPTDLCLGFKATLYASPYSLRDPSRDLGCSVRVRVGSIRTFSFSQADDRLCET